MDVGTLFLQEQGAVCPFCITLGPMWAAELDGTHSEEHRAPGPLQMWFLPYGCCDPHSNMAITQGQLRCSLYFEVSDKAA